MGFCPLTFQFFFVIFLSLPPQFGPRRLLVFSLAHLKFSCFWKVFEYDSLLFVVFEIPNSTSRSPAKMSFFFDLTHTDPLRLLE